MNIRKTLLILISFLFNQNSYSQHCPWDYTSIVVVKPISNCDGKIIEDLKIVLLDTINIPITITKDTLMFWQNLKEISGSQFTIDTHFIGAQVPDFWFANQNYIFLTHTNNEGPIRAIILNSGLDSSKTKFENKIIEISKDYFFPLCTNLSTWKHKEDRSFIKEYKPYQVRLKELNEYQIKTDMLVYSKSDTITMKNILKQDLAIKTTGACKSKPNIEIQKYVDNIWVDYFKNDIILQCGLPTMIFPKKSKINLPVHNLYKMTKLNFDNREYRIVLNSIDGKKIYSNSFHLE